MARRTKDAPGATERAAAARARRVSPTSGRVTPKGGNRPRPPRAGTGTTRYAKEATGRYTAPISAEFRSSPWWVPALMLTFFGLGVMSIVLNYLGVLPSSPSNAYLLGGLGCIIAGFVVSTRWH